MGAIAALAAVVALAGGGVAAVGVHALDDTNKTVTTTVEAAQSELGRDDRELVAEPTPTPRSRAAAASPSSQIYKQDAPGVVTITSTIHVDDVRRLLPVRARPVAGARRRRAPAS